MNELTLMIKLLDCPEENAEILQDNKWFCLKELINDDNNLDSINSTNKHIEGERNFNLVAMNENPNPKFPQQNQKILINLRRMNTNSILHSFQDSNNSDEESQDNQDAHSEDSKVEEKLVWLQVNMKKKRLSINERWQIRYYNEEIEDKEPDSLPEEGTKEEVRNNK